MCYYNSMKKLARMFKSHQSDSQAGFTLMELIVVFALIAIVVGYTLSNSFLASRARARDVARKTQLAQLATALEEYINDYGLYPAASSGRVAGCGVNAAQPCDWGDTFVDDNGTIYMESLPKDVHDPNHVYVYRVNSTRTGWQLYTRLEVEEDPATDQDGDGVGDEYSFVSCGTAGNCNYGLSSGNLTPATEPLP